MSIYNKNGKKPTKMAENKQSLSDITKSDITNSTMETPNSTMETPKTAHPTTTSVVVVLPESGEDAKKAGDVLLTETDVSHEDTKKDGDVLLTETDVIDSNDMHTDSVHVISHTESDTMPSETHTEADTVHTDMRPVPQTNTYRVGIGTSPAVSIQTRVSNLVLAMPLLAFCFYKIHTLYTKDE